jgi:UTP-glucose-1-phosphate uridylyltransferase
VNTKKIKSTVCILTAGFGTRMGPYSSIINKSLLPVKTKAVLSRIIESFHRDSDFVIGVGFNKSQVVNYLNNAHPKLSFNYVSTKKYFGKNSGPGPCLYDCKRFLNKPFFFVSCDTLIAQDSYSNFNLNNNFVAISKVKNENTKNYCNFSIDNKKVFDVYDKIKVPKNKNIYSFSGLCFIKDHQIFWKSLKGNLLKNKEIQISDGFLELIKLKKLFAYKVKWSDLGTYVKYENYKNKFQKYDFSKQNEFIYILNNKIIKFNSDVFKIKNMLIKYRFNKKVFPTNVKHIDNFLVYKFINGKTFYHNTSVTRFKLLLDWLFKKLWVKNKLPKVNLKEDAKKFYFKKTLSRVNMYIKNNSNVNKIKKINSTSVKPIKYYLNKINWNSLYNTDQSFIHGDLQFDNIIFKDNKFTLIDWREKFGENIKCGDLYYDLAKLYGGMHINYDYIKQNKMFFQIDNNNIFFNFKRRKIMDKFIYHFENFLIEKEFNLKKVKLLMAIIFLNMSPLHKEPFNHILFAYSKLLFKKYLNE